MIPIIKLIFYEILNWSLENLFVGPDEYIQRVSTGAKASKHIYKSAKTRPWKARGTSVSVTC